MKVRIKNTALINFRKGLRKRQIEFAEELNVPQSLIAMVENGIRTAPQSLKDKLKEVYNFELPENNDYNNLQLTNIISIPIYNISAAAGKGTWLLDEPIADSLYFDSRWLKNILKVDPKNIHGIFASGDSMDNGTSNSIKDGDLLLVDSSNTLGDNGVFVIRVNNTELRVKRLVTKLDGSLTIISDNQKYPDEIYEAGKSNITVEVMGKVVWNGSKENI
jgi:phage repressor protein C with HTH and peptisase S24 domain